MSIRNFFKNNEDNTCFFQINTDSNIFQNQHSIFSLKMIFLVLAFITFSGCGSSQNSSSNDTIAEASNQFQSQLGPLSDAEVKIFKVENNASTTLLYTETTSAGSSFDDIGYFDSHKNEFEDDSFYLYAVSGGEDWDIEDDGVIDASSTTNTGTLRLLAKGSDLKNNSGQIRVTVLSEIIYASVSTLLKNDISLLEEHLAVTAKSFLTSDINEDGVINYADILNYNPISNQASLTVQYSQSKLNAIITKIHNNDLSYLVDMLESTIATYEAEESSSLVVSKNEKIVYISSMAGLEKLDISDLNAIVQVSVNSSMQYARQLVLSPDESTLFSIIDKKLYLLDAVTLTVISNYTATSNIRSFTLSSDGTTLYLCKYTGSEIEVLDVSDINAVSFIRNIVGSITKPRDVALSSDNTKLLVADEDSGIIYFDVSDIENSDATELLNSGLTSPYTQKVLFSSDEKYAYFHNRDSDRLIIYDLVNETSLGSVYIKSVTDLDLSSDGKYLFVTSGYNVLKIDVSDVVNPKIVSISAGSDSGEDIGEIQISADDTLAYLSTEVGLEVLSITGAVNNSFREIFETSTIDNKSLTLSEDDKYAYIGHSKGFSIYDLQSNTYVYNLNGSELVVDIALDEGANKIYLRKNDKIESYDISDKSVPSVLPNNNTITRSYGLQLSAYKQKIFSVDYDNKFLYVMKASSLNNTNNNDFKNINTSGEPLDVLSSYDDSTVFVVMRNGLGIYSFTNYQNIVADEFVLLSEITDIAISVGKLQYNEDKELLYVGTNKGLLVYDVSDKTAPSVRATYEIYTVDLHMSNDKSKLYIQKDSEIRVLDISDVSNIHEVFTFVTPEGIRSIKESSDSKTLYALTNGSILEYDISFLNEIRDEVAPVAQDLNITSPNRNAAITLIGSDADSDNTDLNYIITKEAIIVGQHYSKPTLLCTGSSCVLSPHEYDTYATSYTFSYKVFDGKQYSKEAKVNVETPSFLGFDNVSNPIWIEHPATSGGKRITVINSGALEYEITTNTDPRFEVTTEKLSATSLRVRVEIIDTSSNILFDLEVSVSAVGSDEVSTKIVPISYDHVGIGD
jgi:hypothetical protein